MNTNHTIELIEGYTAVDPKTKKETTHTTVTIGKRLTAKDLMDLDNDPQGQNPTQYQDLIRRKMITSFGTLTMPVPLNVLLSLDSVDRDDLGAATDKFLSERDGRETEFLENHLVQLAFGFVIDGTEYTRVQFGNRITGRDDVEADAHGNGVARRCFLIGRQISQISTGDGLASIEGQIALETFHALDAESINILWVGAELFRQSFRLKRKVLPGANGGDGLPAGEGNGLDGRPNPESAHGTN